MALRLVSRYQKNSSGLFSCQLEKTNKQTNEKAKTKANQTKQQQQEKQSSWKLITISLEESVAELLF